MGARQNRAVFDEVARETFERDGLVKLEAAFSAEQALLTADAGGQVFRWNVADPVRIAKVHEYPHPAGVQSLALTVDGHLLTGGADFGAGIWSFFAFGRSGQKQRALIDQAIGPIWEANHVWLIVAVTIVALAATVLVLKYWPS